MKAMNTTHVKTGVSAGVVAGIVFGAMMGSMGMLPMIGMLFGSESALLGFLLHIIISIILGALFAIFFGEIAKNETKAIHLGLVWGFIWWILGAGFIMPVWLGMGPQLSAEALSMTLPSLWGHLVFGFILGLVYGYTSEDA